MSLTIIGGPTHNLPSGKHPYPLQEMSVYDVYGMTYDEKVTKSTSLEAFKLSNISKCMSKNVLKAVKFLIVTMFVVS
jgi:hypothetical protein